mgnify:CR=1 FL=1
MSNSREILLGVNIDHVATLRQARGTRYPEPIQAALAAEQAGADAITLHLREDRRHIQDRDVELLAGILQTRMNLEMAATPEMLGIARRIAPPDCCLVPERREELTTEGGLDVAGQREHLEPHLLGRHGCVEHQPVAVGQAVAGRQVGPVPGASIPPVEMVAGRAPYVVVLDHAQAGLGAAGRHRGSRHGNHLVPDTGAVTGISDDGKV